MLGSELRVSHDTGSLKQRGLKAFLKINSLNNVSLVLLGLEPSPPD